MSNAACRHVLLALFIVTFLVITAAFYLPAAASAMRGTIPATNSSITAAMGEGAAKNGSSQNYNLRLGLDTTVARGAGGNFSLYLGWLRTQYGNYSAVQLPAATPVPTATPIPLVVASIVSPLSALEGNTLSFSADVMNNASESVAGLVPSVSVSPAGRATGLVIAPSNVTLLPSLSSANFTANFSYPSSGAITATFAASAVVLSSGTQLLSNAVTTTLYVGNQFTLSLSSGRLEILPKAGASVTIVVKNTAPFARQGVKLKLLNPSCCTFSLTPLSMDLDSNGGGTFTLGISPVSTAQPGTSYTTGVVAYTDTEPSLAVADLTVAILRDAVPETGAARERALSAIRNANDTIGFVDMQVAGAEKNKLDARQAATTLAEARKIYKQALDLLEQSDYDGAYSKAIDALTIAQSALILVPLAPPAAGATVTREQAEAYLKTASDTILFVDTRIAQAERQKLQLQEAVGKLAEARGLFKRAQAALDAGDYNSAADLASKATALARSSLESIPKPGAFPITKTAIAAAAILAIAAIIYFKFVRKPPTAPPAAQRQYYYPQGYYPYQRPQQQQQQPPLR